MSSPSPEQSYGSLFDLEALAGSYDPFSDYDPFTEQAFDAALRFSCIHDLTDVVRYETQEWLDAHGITHNCTGAVVWSVVPSKKNTPKPKPGYVYFFSDQETRKIKIGFSDDPLRRLAEGKTWCPRLELLKTIRVADMAAEEAYYHKRFGRSRYDGEWFLPDKDLMDFISNAESTTYGLMSGIGNEA